MFFSLVSLLGLHILRLYHLWRLVLVSWALNGSLRVVVHQARSGRITARTPSVRKRNFLPESRAEMAWLQPFMHTKVLLRSLTRDSWGRLVRKVKRVLYDNLGSREVTEEWLGTPLCLVEPALNSRPITPVSTDSRELEALTPNQFFLGQHATSFPSLLPWELFEHKKSYVRAQSYTNAIWSRLLCEYVPSLNKRIKWRTHSDSTLKTGDFVWVVEPDNPSGYYPLTRIVKLNYGQYGCSGSALVETATREVTWPIVELALVPPSSGGMLKRKCRV